MGPRCPNSVATSENTDCGVHERNKIQSYTEKNHIFCFFYAFICNNYVFYLHVNSYVRKLKSFLDISRQFRLVQRV